MTHNNKINHTILTLCLIMLGIMIVLVSYAPELYRIFCNATGYGGTTQRASIKKTSVNNENPLITVYFDSNVSADLNWEFRPEQRKVEAHIGDSVKVYYYAKNLSKEENVARATYNITPYDAAPYFFKIECFCFTEERLAPGASARMPLVFYVDEEFLKDENVKEVKNLTLSYTFFKQNDLMQEDIDASRDLRGESKLLDASLNKNESAEFNNDARRK